jgi:hypothetical protein
MVSVVRGLLPRSVLVCSGTLLSAFAAIGCSAEGSTSAEIDEAQDGAARGVAVPDAGRATSSKDASVDARDSSTSDGKLTDATPAVDAGAKDDAAKDAGKKDAAPDAAKDSGTTGADCPLNATYIAKAFAELIASSPTMCLSNPCPASQCCVQIYGVCVDK